MEQKTQTPLTTLFNAIICVFLLGSPAGCLHKANDYPGQLSYEVINSYPHDPSAFTQGLEWDHGAVFEGTGLNGSSSLRRVDYKTGTVELQIDYEKDIFAESVTVMGDRIYQLSWQNKIVFVYSKDDFSLLQTHEYSREGWGLTNDGSQLIASDGSAMLYFLDPQTLVERRRITVQDNSQPVRNLNDLEYVKGRVFANIYKSDKIAIINPDTGVVESWLDLSDLRTLLVADNRALELNGIMYDEETDRLFVTGKFWPKLFELSLTQSDRH